MNPMTSKIGLEIVAIHPDSGGTWHRPTEKVGPHANPSRQRNMAYLDVGRGPPLVCVHGSLCDFRIWSAVLGPLTTKHRVIAVSLRHFFPEHWDGAGDSYSIAQHVDDVIGFIEQFDSKPVDLMG